MNQLTDLHGLFNSLRPEPMVSHLDQSPEVTECSLCTNQATREIKYLTRSGKVAHLFVCGECYAEDGLWEGRQIIKTTHL